MCACVLWCKKRFDKLRYQTVVDHCPFGTRSRHQPNAIFHSKQACSNYIFYLIRDGEELGIVWFSTDANIKEDLTRIENNGDRNKLLKQVPDDKDVGGNTAIGRGEKKNIQISSV